MDDLINKIWSIHAAEYSALKRQEIQTHTTTWMNPEDTVLNEINQS